MQYVLSGHARQEIERRGIAIALVEKVLQAPGQTVPGHGSVVCYQSVLAGHHKPYLLRVMVNPLTKPPTVVTVYRTNKIRKYWEPE